MTNKKRTFVNSKPEKLEVDSAYRHIYYTAWKMNHGDTNNVINERRTKFANQRIISTESSSRSLLADRPCVRTFLEPYSRNKVRGKISFSKLEASVGKGIPAELPSSTSGHLLLNRNSFMDVTVMKRKLLACLLRAEATHNKQHYHGCTFCDDIMDSIMTVYPLSYYLRQEKHVEPGKQNSELHGSIQIKSNNTQTDKQLLI